MKTSNIPNFTLAVLLLFVFMGHASAGKSEITWTDPEKYSDVKPSNDSSSDFQERIFKKFEKHFSQLSEKLPEGQILKINVTNVDLAGDTRFYSIDQIRVIKDIYIPRLKFTYELIKADKSVLEANEVDLKDMSFLMSSSRSNNDTLYYEKRMLDKWFKKTFIKSK